MFIKKFLTYCALVCLSLTGYSLAITLQIPEDQGSKDFVVGNTVIKSEAVNETSLFDLIKLINDYLRFSIGAICFGVLIYGGFGLITAQGNEEKMKKANKILMGALFGIIISILSYAIVRLVVNLF